MNREDHRLASRKDLGPTVAEFLLLSVRSRQGFWISALVGNPPEAGRSAGRENDGAVGTPARAAKIWRVTQGQGLATRKRDLLQLAVCRESDPPAVGRAKGAQRAFRARNRSRAELIHRS